MHAVGARLVGGGADDAALDRVAVATDDDPASPQLRMVQHLDRCDELVEVDVQHPAGHTLIVAPPTGGRWRFRLWPRSPASASAYRSAAVRHGSSQIARLKIRIA